MGVFIGNLIAFAVILFVLWKYAVPPVKRLMKERQDTVRAQLEESRIAREKLAEAGQAGERARSDAAREGSQIRDEARGDADAIREELRAQTDREVARIGEHGHGQIALNRSNLVRGLRAGLGAEAVEQRCRARTRRVAADLVQAGMKFTDVRAIVRRFGRDQLGLDAAQLGVAVEHVVDRRLRQAGGFLRDVGDHPARRHVEVALVGMELVAQQGEQAGLAAAVGAGEADLPAGVDLQRGGLDEDLGAAREAQIAKTDHERIHGRTAAG